MCGRTRGRRAQARRAGIALGMRRFTLAADGNEAHPCGLPLRRRRFVGAFRLFEAFDYSVGKYCADDRRNGVYRPVGRVAGARGDENLMNFVGDSVEACNQGSRE